MQHLRPVGVQEDGVDSVLIETPSTSKPKNKAQSKRKNALESLDLPDGVLASTSELPRTFESEQAVPDSIAGFQPDMDAHLRQVLEALEDDAFVDDNLDDDFFGELVADGERASDEDFEFEFKEEGIDVNEEPQSESVEDNWENRFADFKRSQKGQKGGSDDGHSEGEDTVGTLRAMSVIGGKKRRKGTSDASGYSMSSSSMYRNEALQTLDERFDQVGRGYTRVSEPSLTKLVHQMILKEYKEDGDEETTDDGNHSDEAPELITSREDFDSMVNEFLNDFEILGRKLKPKLEGESGIEKLDVLRRAMGQDERIRVVDGEEDDNDDDLFPSDDEDKKDRWDCETILSELCDCFYMPEVI